MLIQSFNNYRSLEEMQLMETRHHHEIKVLKSQCSALQQKISMQEKAQEELTNKMREHLSAQLNSAIFGYSNWKTPYPKKYAFDVITFSCGLISGAWQQQTASPASEISDVTALTSDSTSTTNAQAIKRAEMQQFVEQVLLKREKDSVGIPYLKPSEPVSSRCFSFLFDLFSLKVMAQRQSAPPLLKAPNKRSDPAPSRKK